MVCSCQDCQELPLSHTVCEWVSNSDGQGGSEQLVETTATADECAAIVQKTIPSANGATWSTSSKECYAEFGMVSTSDLAEFEATFLASCEMGNPNFILLGYWRGKY